jgi:arginine decarboxylase
MRKWKVDDSVELYNINSWGTDYFSVTSKGNIVVRPKEGGPEIDLRNLIDELQLHDIALPLLLRFPDILNNRISKISKCCDRAAE